MGAALLWTRLRRAMRPRHVLEVFAAPGSDLPAVLFEEAGAGMVAADRAGRIVRANAALRDMVGSLPEAAPGRPVLGLFAPAARQQVDDELRAVLAGRARPSFISQLADPRPAPDAAVSVTAVALRDPLPAGNGGAGEPPAGALLRIADITAQRQLQAQLAQAQKLQAVGSLAGGIAHDFNNVLTAVLGAADAIAARTALDAESADDLAQITASARRAEALVRQLLAFGRQQTLQPQVLAVNERMADLSRMLQRLLGSKVRLELALEEPGRRVQADPTQLDQVLLNLAVNARDAMPDGGTLTLRSGHVNLYRPLVGVEVIPPGRYVMIEVADTGTGMPPEVLARIFDPFFTTKRDRGGTGLGLSTVHGIVRQSDGFLGVHSEPGRGTQVRVYLPRYDGGEMAIPHLPPASAGAAAGSVPTPVPTPVPSGGRGLVLVVDDEDSLLRLADRALTRQGWRVLAASGGEQALALLDTLAPGEVLRAVVSDIVMPGMDGPALVQAVRARLGAPLLPAVLVSGYAEASLRAALGAADRVGFLPKPYTLKQLTERVAEEVLGHVAADRAA